MFLELQDSRVRQGDFLLNQDQEEAFDYLTVFRELFCTFCQNMIGKYYFSTTRKLHHLEKLFCLEKVAILQYCLGGISKGDLNTTGSNEPNMNHTSQKDSETNLEELPTLIGLKQDILKLQKLVVHLFGCYQSLSSSSSSTGK